MTEKVRSAVSLEVKLLSRGTTVQLENRLGCRARVVRGRV